MFAAAVIAAPGAAVEVREYPEPPLEPDSALLAVELSKVCGTDVHLRDGRLAGVPYPLIPGHVSVGVLAKVRGRLRDVDGNALSEGDRVTFLDVHRTCNACWHCLVAKASTHCPSRRVYGITYGADDVLAGGWAEAIYLKPGTRIIPLGAASFDAKAMADADVAMHAGFPLDAAASIALRRARGASDGALQRRSCGARYVEGVVVTR